MMAGMEVILVPAGLLGLAMFIVTIWASVRILGRIGHSGWWVLIGFVPVLNIALIWALALQRWPIDDESDSGIGRTGGTGSARDDSTLWSPGTLNNAGPPDDTPAPPTVLPPSNI